MRQLSAIVRVPPLLEQDVDDLTVVVDGAPYGILDDLRRKPMAFVSGSRVSHPGMFACPCLTWQYR